MAKNNSKAKTKSTKPTKKETIDIKNRIINISENGKDKKIPLNNKQIAEILYGKRFKLRGKNKNQDDLIKKISKNEITIAIGPADVGKSYISVAKALELLAHPDNNYQKIYVITPAVDADEKLGYLKGTLEEKLDPYLFSTYYLIDKIIGKDNRKMLQEMEIVEPLALAFIKGMNIDNAILILEEGQNTTPGQMKNLLTRIGFNSKFIISGDLEQVDRTTKEKCGLYDALVKLEGMNGIGQIKFTKEDVVRNPLITNILNRYDDKND